jgi:hypothetical protein
VIYRTICKKEKENIKNEDENLNKKPKSNLLIIKDLFDFNLDELFIYDETKDRGILYIKGIVGISILFTILGQLFLLFLNIYIKSFGKYQFHEILSSFSYIFIYIGLRYSPRILFSCSGFTLAYKALRFHEKNKNCFLIRFFFLQFYKYIILFLSVLYFRYSLYEIISLIGDKPVWKALDQFELKKPSNGDEFFRKSINIGGFLDYIKQGDDSKYSNDLFDYLWMPFNEIFFFVIGILLISLGLTKKRIDWIILVLMLLLYLQKFLYIQSGIETKFIQLYIIIFLTMER